jgi:hypothetical protein
VDLGIGTKDEPDQLRLVGGPAREDAGALGHMPGRIILICLR